MHLYSRYYCTKVYCFLGDKLFYGKKMIRWVARICNEWVAMNNSVVELRKLQSNFTISELNNSSLEFQMTFHWSFSPVQLGYGQYFPFLSRPSWRNLRPPSNVLTFALKCYSPHLLSFQRPARWWIQWDKRKLPLSQWQERQKSNLTKPVDASVSVAMTRKSNLTTAASQISELKIPNRKKK